MNSVMKPVMKPFMKVRGIRAIYVSVNLLSERLL
ncbi:MAG: hypothetical protein ACI9W6_002283 [Motiliproteus sp.]|jgi:hypothetical protein